MKVYLINHRTKNRIPPNNWYVEFGIGYQRINIPEHRYGNWFWVAFGLYTLRIEWGELV